MLCISSKKTVENFEVGLIQSSFVSGTIEFCFRLCSNTLWYKEVLSSLSLSFLTGKIWGLDSLSFNIIFRFYDFRGTGIRQFWDLGAKRPELRWKRTSPSCVNLGKSSHHWADSLHCKRWYYLSYWYMKCLNIYRECKCFLAYYNYYVIIFLLTSNL